MSDKENKKHHPQHASLYAGYPIFGIPITVLDRFVSQPILEAKQQLAQELALHPHRFVLQSTGCMNKSNGRVGSALDTLSIPAKKDQKGYFIELSKYGAELHGLFGPLLKRRIEGTWATYGDINFQSILVRATPYAVVESELINPSPIVYVNVFQAVEDRDYQAAIDRVPNGEKYYETISTGGCRLQMRPAEEGIISGRAIFLPTDLAAEGYSIAVERMQKESKSI